MDLTMSLSFTFIWHQYVFMWNFSVGTSSASQSRTESTARHGIGDYHVVKFVSEVCCHWNWRRSCWFLRQRWLRTIWAGVGHIHTQIGPSYKWESANPSSLSLHDAHFDVSLALGADDEWRDKCCPIGAPVQRGDGWVHLQRVLTASHLILNRFSQRIIWYIWYGRCTQCNVEMNRLWLMRTRCDGDDWWEIIDEKRDGRRGRWPWSIGWLICT